MRFFNKSFVTFQSFSRQNKKKEQQQKIQSIFDVKISWPFFRSIAWNPTVSISQRFSVWNSIICILRVKYGYFIFRTSLITRKFASSNIPCIRRTKLNLVCHKGHKSCTVPRVASWYRYIRMTMVEVSVNYNLRILTWKLLKST